MFEYLYSQGQAPAPFEHEEWIIAEKFGWTLEYIESLPITRINEYYAIMDGRGKARSAHGN